MRFSESSNAASSTNEFRRRLLSAPKTNKNKNKNNNNNNSKPLPTNRNNNCGLLVVLHVPVNTRPPHTGVSRVHLRF